jgi:uncharacterized protein (TIGR03437 family)
LYPLRLRPFPFAAHHIDVTLRTLFVSALLAMAVRAQNTAITVVSAASYRPIIASDSLAATFGTGLARTTVSATLDENGNLPTELASTRVEFNGTAAALIFVSPTQINFVVPSGIAAGSTVVTLRSTDTNTTRTTTVQVANTAPALFSSDASGSGSGAILNAVTFAPAPFLTVTGQNGADTQTRLAAYGTGFRNAKNVSASATDSQGNRYSLTVEFVGAAPGFAGLDQLNIVILAALDGAGAVSLTVSTEDAVSNAVTFQMNLLPLNQLLLARITLNPAAVNGGDTITATIGLNGVARTGGFLVSLRSNNLAAQPPGFATIPQGVSTLDVPVPTSSVTSVQNGVINAQAGSVTVSTGFEVDPLSQGQLAAFSVTPTSSLGGRALQGTIGLSSAAPGGGINVQITSDNTAAQPPAIVIVPFAQFSFSFQIPTTAVTAPQTVTFTATSNRVSLTSSVTLAPILSLALDPNPVVGGTPVTGSITLADPAPPGGVTIALYSSDLAAARVPALVSIGAGQNFSSFNITTTQLSAQRNVTISAVYLGLTATDVLSVNPVPLPTLSSLSVSPNLITGGQSTQGTVTLAAPAPAGGITVNLLSSSNIVAMPPPFVNVPQGFTTAIFTINTFRVPVTETATITATSSGISRTAVITVQ